MSEVACGVGSAVCSLAPTVGMCLDQTDATSFGYFLTIVASAVISAGFLTRITGIRARRIWPADAAPISTNRPTSCVLPSLIDA
jgi:hypothetical protein